MRLADDTILVLIVSSNMGHHSYMFLMIFVFIKFTKKTYWRAFSKHPKCNMNNISFTRSGHYFLLFTIFYNMMIRIDLLKIDCNTVVFLWNLGSFQEHLFSLNILDGCFWNVKTLIFDVFQVRIPFGAFWRLTYVRIKSS